MGRGARAAILALALGAMLGSCSLAERLANGAIAEPSGEVIEPNGVVIEPTGQVIEPNGEPIVRDEAIQTVITGLGEAQQVRTLTRQLAR